MDITRRTSRQTSREINQQLYCSTVGMFRGLGNLRKVCCILGLQREEQRSIMTLGGSLVVTVTLNIYLHPPLQCKEHAGQPEGEGPDTPELSTIFQGKSKQFWRSTIRGVKFKIVKSPKSGFQLVIGHLDTQATFSTVRSMIAGKS